MADISKTTTSVVFSTNISSDGIFNFELNSDLNGDKTKFLQGEPVYINLYHTLDVDTINSTNGNVTLYKTMSKRQVQETALFTNTKVADLSYPIDQTSGIDFRWYGQSLGNIHVTGYSTISASRAGYGVGIVNYTTFYDVYKLIVPADIPNNEERVIIVFGNDVGGNEAYVNITVQGNKLSDKDIIIESKDYDLDLPIPGAEVYIDGEFMGLTNGYGKLNVGKLPLGKYNLKIVASGYKTTDQDALNNDFFVVE